MSATTLEFLLAMLSGVNAIQTERQARQGQQTRIALRSLMSVLMHTRTQASQEVGARMRQLHQLGHSHAAPQAAAAGWRSLLQQCLPTFTVAMLAHEGLEQMAQSQSAAMLF